MKLIFIMALFFPAILGFFPVHTGGSTISSNFSVSPASGIQPLSVSFISPAKSGFSHESWFFGDESFTGPWLQATLQAPWQERWGFTAVAMPDGNIVLMGGFVGIGAVAGEDRYTNDTWRSTDGGATWTKVNASSGWPARGYLTSVVLPDGNIVLTGGYGPSIYYNDTWLSKDEGSTWTMLNSSSGWSARFGQNSVATPDSEIILFGGYGYYNLDNDVWRSADEGKTWNLVNGSPGWSPRYSPASVVTKSGDILVMGGYDSGEHFNNDVWRSPDNGLTWILVNRSAGWSPRHAQSAVMLPDGTIVLMGGGAENEEYLHDLWKSPDNGVTWTPVQVDSAWSGRAAFSTVLLANGTITLMGGYNLTGLKNDVWQFSPSGSSLPNPIHTYQSAGRYSVALRVSDNTSFSETVKPGYLTVYEPYIPIHSLFFRENGTMYTDTDFNV